MCKEEDYTERGHGGAYKYLLTVDISRRWNWELV
jgi:hypothetical protein